jgi:hypothetical protein
MNSLATLFYWPEACAVVQTSRLYEVTYNGRTTQIVQYNELHVRWSDRAGKPHRGVVTVTDDSDLYQLYEGKSLSLRYCAFRTSWFFVQKQWLYRVWMALKYLAGLVVLGFMVWWLDRK